MIPDKFWQPWSEIDPSGESGGIDGELGDFVGPRLGDNPKTKNIDIYTIFQVVSDCAAALSVHPEADREGLPTRNLVEEALRAWNFMMERIVDRTRVASAKYHMWVHARPPMVDFLMRPIRFPLRNNFANQSIYFLLGELVEIAECNANDMHTCLDPSTGHMLISPLYHWKANIIRDFFDQECAGEVTLDELQTMFQGLTPPGPTIVQPSESQPKPSADAVKEALAGVDVIQWFPTDEEWQIFGKKQTEAYKPERVYQPEGARATTEDVAPEHGVSAQPAITPG